GATFRSGRCRRLSSESRIARCAPLNVHGRWRMRILVLESILVAVLAAGVPGVASAQASAAGEPIDCTKLEGLDAQMACLKQHIDGLKALSADAEPIETLPPDEPRIIGDRNSAACHARGKSQPVWPNGQPMGPTAN